MSCILQNDLVNMGQMQIEILRNYNYQQQQKQNS